MSDEKEPSPAADSESMKGKVVVIAEDDPNTGKLLETVLSKAGFEVILTTDGKEALPKIKTSDPQVIIADVLMPEMSGFDLLKEVRKDKKTAGIPFFIISVRKNMEESFLGLGVDGFMAKPLQTENFLEQIKTLAKRPRREPAEEKSEEKETSGEEKKDTSEEEKEKE